MLLVLSSGSSRSHSSITKSENAAYLFMNFVVPEGLSRASCQAPSNSGIRMQCARARCRQAAFSNPNSIIRWPPRALLAIPPGGPQSEYRWPPEALILSCTRARDCPEFS